MNMALNKYMHPRNIYKTPPDFAKLSKSFEEFSCIAETDVTGKVTINFKNPHCLRVLTKCLLKSDFGLDVVIPEDRLVPTLPLRLNYILWIEDLLNSIDRKDNIKGLDIGTGACAIYPLLAASKNKWHMVATESDQESFQKAQENVDRNDLQNYIQLSKNLTSKLIEHLFSEDVSPVFDFCMCNPPFYSNELELCESRSPSRLPPKNAFTGSPQELITEGGELFFCRKLIHESKVYKDNILIFSTMIGHKFNMKELAQDLQADGIKYTTTEFCQGRVTRWGLAWTYQNFEIGQLVPARDKPRKKNSPVIYVLPEVKDSPHQFQAVSKKLLDIIKILQMKYKILEKKGNCMSLDVVAVENTWSNQRRKRRLMKMQQGDSKKPKLNETGNSKTVDNVPTAEEHSGNDSKGSIVTEEECQSNLKLNPNDIDNCSITTESDIVNTDTGKYAARKDMHFHDTKLLTNTSHSSEPADTCSEKNDFRELKPLVHAFFKLYQKDNNMLLEIEFLDGSTGKEGVHQILQYIKNNWKYFVFYFLSLR